MISKFVVDKETFKNSLTLHGTLENGKAMSLEFQPRSFFFLVLSYVYVKAHTRYKKIYCPAHQRFLLPVNKFIR